MGNAGVAIHTGQDRARRRNGLGPDDEFGGDGGFNDGIAFGPRTRVVEVQPALALRAAQLLLAVHHTAIMATSHTGPPAD